ncbi:hypothetical protein Asppvi_006959 [Aspergillus pseudoviridinutans]|uniref:NADP-dependent L-serine/L-allo-threonine dehydrogenase ydfG n=1 Tax=Aspergillus pseudoviridinutans TaxID=1517512 RepID=A0A9P3EWH8_9EURO|nr:uncharacterized protein Asppvi_006959 [Aspergillus pseudoviridinutans]GIJ88043.1 hypothetical protein Asppvi_006959 [Aspergillus pseudoviridinutans]
MSLSGKIVLLTGASMGIGEAIARDLANHGADLILFSRSEDKLSKLTKELTQSNPSVRVIHRAVDVGDFEAVDAAVESSVNELGAIDVLINGVGTTPFDIVHAVRYVSDVFEQAGIALGAPNAFYNLKVSDIQIMNSTNVNGPMFVTHAVLNRGMLASKQGVIMNITSVTGLEVPPFPGEAVYHASKACQEAFTNALRNELIGTNIKVLALRPGCVATNFHSQRVGHDKEQYDAFFEGYTPLTPDDIAQAAVYMLNQPLNVSIKALDVVPSAQRSLAVFDRRWSERNGQ